MTTLTARLFSMASSLGRPFIVLGTVVAALTVNLLILAIGTACGADFTYFQSGSSMTVDAVAVTILTVFPLSVGLTFVAWVSPKWPWLLRFAMVAGPALALGTIAVMTLPTAFDTRSKAFLVLMHIALAVVTVAGLRILAVRSGRQLPSPAPVTAALDEASTHSGVGD